MEETALVTALKSTIISTSGDDCSEKAGTPAFPAHAEGLSWIFPLKHLPLNSIPLMQGRTD